MFILALVRSLLVLVSSKLQTKTTFVPVSLYLTNLLLQLFNAYHTPYNLIS